MTTVKTIRFFIVLIALSFLYGFQPDRKRVKHPKPNEEFLEVLNDKSLNHLFNLNFGGLYIVKRYENLNKNTEVYGGMDDGSTKVLYTVFFRNGIFLMSPALTEHHIADLTVVIEESYSNYVWGTYYQEGNSLYAYSYLWFHKRGAYGNFVTIGKFTGRVEGDRIIDFRMVTSYPYIEDRIRNNKNNDDYIEYLEAPKTFEFVPEPTKTLIDSNRAWILRYRK